MCDYDCQNYRDYEGSGTLDRGDIATWGADGECDGRNARSLSTDRCEGEHPPSPVPTLHLQTSLLQTVLLLQPPLEDLRSSLAPVLTNRRTPPGLRPPQLHLRGSCSGPSARRNSHCGARTPSPLGKSHSTPSGWGQCVAIPPSKPYMSCDWCGCS